MMLLHEMQPWLPALWPGVNFLGSTRLGVAFNYQMHAQTESCFLLTEKGYMAYCHLNKMTTIGTYHYTKNVVTLVFSGYK